MAKTTSAIDIRNLRRTRKQPRTVSVTIPTTAAYDLKQFQAIQKDILSRLGCPACTSGHDIRFEMFNRFMVDDKLQITESYLT